MRKQTKLLSLVVALLFLGIIVAPASAQDTGHPVTLRAIDESSNLIPGVTFKIYRCTSSPPYSPIELVRTETSSSGELYIADLPKDYYCVEVSKTGYSQRYPTEENRFANHDSSPTLNIVMDNEDPAVPTRVVIYDRDLYEYIDTSKSGTQTSTEAKYPASENLNDIVFKDITKAQVLDFLVYEVSGNHGRWLNGTIIEDGRHEFTYNFNGADRPGVLYLNRKTDSSGNVISTQFTILLKDWDIGALRGQQSIKMPFYLYSGSSPLGGVSTPTNTYICRMIGSDLRIPPPSVEVKITEKTGIIWKHHIKVSKDSTTYYIDIDGFIDGHKFTSEVVLSKDDEIFSKFTNPGEKIHRSILKTEINQVKLISPYGTEHAFPLYGDDVEFRPFDINGNVPLNGVQITVYTCDPVTLEPGKVVDIFTVDYGDIKTLPRGYYCIEASLNNYEQVYSISDTRFSNVDGPTVALIPMKREEVIEPNQPVEFRPFDINGNVPLNRVQITVYTCDPVTFEPGSVVDIFTVDYGYIKSLPRGHYCIEASLNNYEQVYSISDTRFSNVDGPAVALIPMKREYVGGEDGTVEVRIFDVDTEEPLQNVRVRIYEALPNFQQGRLVKDVTVNSGDYISLPAGRYFAQATKSGYSQYFEVTNTRVVVDPPSPSILYIPMTSRDVVTPGEGSFLDQSIKGIANLFGVSFGVGKTILGMLLALGIGTATAKQLRGGAQEFGLGMLGGVVLGVLIGLLPIWVLVLLVLVVGLWIGQRYMSGGDS